MMARFYCYLDPLSSHQLKNVVKVGPPLAKLSGSAHVHLHPYVMFVSIEGCADSPEPSASRKFDKYQILMCWFNVYAICLC